MNQGTYALAASMFNQINNNLANSNTNGFKQDGLTETTFNKYLQRVQNKGLVANEISTISNNIPKIDVTLAPNEYRLFLKSILLLRKRVSEIYEKFGLQIVVLSHTELDSRVNFAIEGTLDF